MIYAVFVLDEDAEDYDLTSAVRKVDDEAYVTYAPRAYFLSFKGPASSLRKLLGLKDYPINVFVAAIKENFGFANADLWEWIKERE